MLVSRPKGGVMRLSSRYIMNLKKNSTDISCHDSNLVYDKRSPVENWRSERIGPFNACHRFISLYLNPAISLCPVCSVAFLPGTEVRGVTVGQGVRRFILTKGFEASTLLSIECLSEASVHPLFNSYCPKQKGGRDYRSQSILSCVILDAANSTTTINVIGVTIVILLKIRLHCVRERTH